MRVKAKRRRVRKSPEYPDETKGTRWAAEARKKASKLSPEQREELFRRGMARIYGGEAQKATLAGH